MLEKAEKIENHFEQAFFAMVQFPYLQPFEDVNKRVSRLGANIPFIKHNLCPLSFVEVAREEYGEAILSLYETTRVDLLRDLFVNAYERSAARYSVVQQTIKAPDPIRVRYREALKEVVGQIIRQAMSEEAASQFIQDWALRNIVESDRPPFIEICETELLHLHEGNFARYQVRPSEFSHWHTRFRA